MPDHPSTGRFADDVFPAEIEEIRARRRRVGIPTDDLTPQPRSGNGLIGLALSGGGIRSATLGLGVIQALDACGLLKAVDYLSTVSGGGFIGGCLSSMQSGAPPATDPWATGAGVHESAAVRHVRNNSRYLAPGGMLDTVRIGAILIRGVIVNAMTFAPYVMAAVLITAVLFDYNLARSASPVYSSLVDRTLRTAVSVFVGLIVTFPMLSTLGGRWLNLAWRGRYDALLSIALVVLLLSLASVPLFDLASAAASLTSRDLDDGVRDIVAAAAAAPLWQYAAACAAIGAAIVLAIRLSRASSLWLMVELNVIGLLAPVALLAGFLLLCIFQIETPQLETLAWDAAADTTSASALDRGLVPERIERARPKIERPWANADVLADGERAIANGAGKWAAPGAVYLFGDDGHGVTNVRLLAFSVDWPMNNELQELDGGHVPARLADELLQHKDIWRSLAETTVAVSTPHAEWTLTGPDQFTFLVKRAARSLRVYWQRPLAPGIGVDDSVDVLMEAARHALGDPSQLADRAHVTTIEPGRSWQLTTSGRAITVRAEHQRLRLFWDLTPSLEHQLRSDVLVSSFASVEELFVDPKGSLPEPLHMNRAYAIEGARVAGWALCRGEPSDSRGCDLRDRGTFFVAEGDESRFWSTKRADLSAFSQLGVGVLLLVFFLMNALFINVNRNSAHGFYRDRLSAAYVIKPDPSGPDRIVANDVQKLSTLNGDGSIAPYHLINCTMNLSGSADPDMRNRFCDFFVFSKRFCGSVRTNYWKTTELERRDPHVSLATALAISAAAAAPNAGTATIAPARFILTLLNVRLDYWVPNPAMMRRWWKRIRLHMGLGSMYLWREALGSIDGDGPFVNVSDGSHIENLGVYELLRRRCRLIIAADNDADPEYRFDDLLALIMRARIDLGVEIEIDLEALRRNDKGLSGGHFIVGHIRYGTEDGWLVYVKASLTGDEGELVRDYCRSNPQFPHQSTANQFFNERQFEMYRDLGYHIGERLVAGVIDLGELSPAFSGPLGTAALAELRRAVALHV